MRRLAGKVAMVTGGGSGMGRAASVAMAREGARVTVVDIDMAAATRIAVAITESRGEALPLQVDVRKESDVKAAIETIVDRFGRLDILYTCAIDSADVSKNDGLLADLDLEVVRRIIDVNLFGALNCAKHAAVQMRAQGSGTIIFSGTVDALIGCAGLDAYTAAKGGVIAVTRSLAAGLGPYGVRVNAICPGFVKTEAHEDWLKDARAVETMQRLHILPMPEAEEVAPLVVYLASDESRCVTGALWPIDSGYSACKVAGDEARNILGTVA
jgi:NAD(P)-dependent dehydrogenase (short-subunit alcohol dehydrogenase family)